MLFSASRRAVRRRGVLTASRNFWSKEAIDNLIHQSAVWKSSFRVNGFKNFYPKKAGKPETKAKPIKSNNQSSGSQQGGNEPGKGKYPMLPLLAVSGLLTLLLVGFPSFPTDDNFEKVTWKDFRSRILPSGDVTSIHIFDRHALILVGKKDMTEIPTLQQQESLNESTMPVDPPVESFTSRPLPLFSDSRSSSLARFVDKDVEEVMNASKVYHINITSAESFERKLDQAQAELGIPTASCLPVSIIPSPHVESGSGSGFMSTIITTILLGLPLLFLIRYAAGKATDSMGSAFKFGKSTAKKINKELVTVTFKDVAGIDQAKREIVEFVEFLKTPEKFTSLGAKIPKGALLCGPPGTGKTLLAKAVAGEANVPFYSMSGSDFIEMFVGVGPSRVRDLFKEARANAPCIIFIDEIDAVGRKRARGGFSAGGHDERESTLNQLLVEMDGFDASTGVIVLAGTNRADILDEALLRPGRFDRQISIDKPDLKGRRDIFEVHLVPLKLASSVSHYSGRLAALTPGFTGADISNICNEAAIISARKSRSHVLMMDFEQAIDRILAGLESNKLMSDDERKSVAYHEAGHAVAGWNLQHADPLLKVTIIPRGSGALGFAQYLPRELSLRSTEQLKDMIVMALAGRASEVIHIGRVTTGASDDLKRVTQIAYAMVSAFGMSSEIGQLSLQQDNESSGYGGSTKPYSDATAAKIDAEAKKIVDSAYELCLDLISRHTAQVKSVAELLLKQETITHDDIILLIGPRPFASSREYEDYVVLKKDLDEVKIDSGQVKPGIEQEEDIKI